ncbi:MAG: tryptophan 2,3-dioxygenase, partial [Bacteroidota bacterium]|nr:tryptophan 2,3-dioxygenase [Bacteroidota bacterium]
LLDTMTPLDFLEFRNLLTPASGFQSVQFRMVEATLGLKISGRHQKEYYKRTNEGGFEEDDYKKINMIEGNHHLLQLINSWLERLPFFENEFWLEYESQFPRLTDLHPFWSDYRMIYKTGLTPKEAGKIHDFDFIFLEQQSTNHNAETQAEPALSAKALRAALFIMLYRDFPVFQTSYQILDSLVEIDHQMATWRHKHLVMVRRLIGLRMGTGNTSGRGYLEGALNSHYIFKDIAGLSTFLIERRKLPALPDKLIRNLSYS